MLEYCCKFDYKMIITTLNIEKREELEQIEEKYKDQLVMFEENQRRLLENENEQKEHIRRLQRQLDYEIQKKEELEDELTQKGSGHEEEVSIRIQFENKVNQMYAKQRDMETKSINMQELLTEQQKTLEIQTLTLVKEKKKYEEVLESKEKFENEVKRLEEKNKQNELTIFNLEQRLNDTYKQIDQLTVKVSKASAIVSESKNDMTQKKIEIEDKKFELEIKFSMITKLEKTIEEQKTERNNYLKRIIELEALYQDECDKNHHYKQEYARIKESNNFHAVEYLKYKEKAESFESQCEGLKEEKQKQKIQLESLIQGYEEFKIQLKKAQERIEEMNKGRRFVEEQNEFLNFRLSEKNEELKDSRNMNLELKDDLEKLKTRETILESELSTALIKLQSLEKQYEANKETMQQKINTQSDILNSEKIIRENWIFKYEEEQKSNSVSNRLLLVTQDQYNELQIKYNSATALIEEKNGKINFLAGKNSELVEELLEVKVFQEELQRKNKTFLMLYENSERERALNIKNHGVEVEQLNQGFREAKECLVSGIEEVRVYASVNLEKLNKKTQDFDELMQKYLDLVDLQADTKNKLDEATLM